MPVPPRLRGEQPDHPRVGERVQRVDQRIHQVAVVVPPPQQHDVDDVVRVLVDHLAAGPLGDRVGSSSSVSSSQPRSCTTMPGSIPSRSARPRPPAWSTVRAHPWVLPFGSAFTTVRVPGSPHIPRSTRKYATRNTSSCRGSRCATGSLNSAGTPDRVAASTGQGIALHAAWKLRVAAL